LAKLAQELAVITGYLIIGKESVISDVVPVIKADKILSLDAKRALVTLIKQLQKQCFGNHPFCCPFPI
jgi:hypothetical protein